MVLLHVKNLCFHKYWHTPGQWHQTGLSVKYLEEMNGVDFFDITRITNYTHLIQVHLENGY